LRYSPQAIGLHWLMAFFLVVAFCIGQYMSGLELSPWKLKIYAWHKWLGVTLFLLVWLRLSWRLTHRPPDFPATWSANMKRLAGVGHLALYILMIAIPLTGWLHSSAAGISVVYLNLIPLPDLIPKNRALSHLFRILHQNLNWAMLVLVLGHIAAALKHQFLDKDHLLARMRPCGGE
jgi:cytochrome b561